MLPYFLLLFVPLLLQVLLQKSGKCIRINKKGTCINCNNIVLPAFFTLYTMLLVFRHETIGRDLPNYKYLFFLWGNESIKQIFSSLQECFFRFYCWLIYNFFTENYQAFLAITAVVTVIPIAVVYCRDKRYGYLKAALFVNMSTFIMFFSGIRQGMAIALGVLAYQALRDEKKKLYIAYAISAALIHHTGFMIFLYYPIVKEKIKKKDMIWIAPFGLVICILNRPLFFVLTSILRRFSDKYDGAVASTGAMGSFLLFLLFSIFSYIVMDENKMDEESFAFRNMLLIATVLQSFASLNTLAMRMNYYFIIFIPIAVGKSMEYVDTKYTQVARLSKIVIEVFFSVIFVYSTYRSYITGISTLDTIPYIPFWRGSV